jgi:alanine-synthesizing transaminase
LQPWKKPCATACNGYAPSLGVPEAVEAIRAEAERKGIRNIQSVFLTAGVSEALDICLTALVNAGENVSDAQPGVPLVFGGPRQARRAAQFLFARRENEWQPDLEDIARKINSGTRAIVVSNPNNPTGAVYSRQTLERIVELARQHNLVIFRRRNLRQADSGRRPAPPSLAALAPDVPVVTFNGLSKSYLVPGWRVGWGVVSGKAAAVKPYLEGIHQLLRARLCSNHPQQFAVRPALEGPQDHLARGLREAARPARPDRSACRDHPT